MSETSRQRAGDEVGMKGGGGGSIGGRLISLNIMVTPKIKFTWGRVISLHIIQLSPITLLYMLSTISAMKNKMYAVQTNLCIQLEDLEDQRNLKIYN